MFEGQAVHACLCRVVEWAAPAAGGTAARAQSTRRRKSGLKDRSLSFTVSASSDSTAARSTSATPAADTLTPLSGRSRQKLINGLHQISNEQPL